MNEITICNTEPEAVTKAIREHAQETKDWIFHGIAVRMGGLFEAANMEFFGGVLPEAVIGIGPDLIVRYGYYRIGRDDIGAKHRIHLNSRHFGRAESDVAVTLLHEMVHLYQHEFGRPSRRGRYHNRQFVDFARRFGLEVEIGSGRTNWVRALLLKTLGEMGMSSSKALVPDTDGSPIRRPVRKVKWQCVCGQEVWAPRGEAVHAMCHLCNRLFARYGEHASAPRARQQDDDMALALLTSREFSKHSSVAPGT